MAGFDQKLQFYPKDVFNCWARHMSGPLKSATVTPKKSKHSLLGCLPTLPHPITAMSRVHRLIQPCLEHPSGSQPFSPQQGLFSSPNLRLFLQDLRLVWTNLNDIPIPQGSGSHTNTKDLSSDIGSKISDLLVGIALERMPMSHKGYIYIYI